MHLTLNLASKRSEGLNVIVAGIPAYNEEKTIAKVILLAQKHVDKVIVCDDGSTDLTADIAQKMGAVVIQHSKNLGYGAAIQSLFDRARTLEADVMLTLDADGQHNADEIPNLLKPIQDGKADIIIGSRFMKETNNKVPRYRRVGIKLITKMSNSTLKGKISDAQSGFRTYNKKAVQGLRILENGMGVSTEILLKAEELGLRVAEVPITVNYKGLDASTHNPVRHGLQVIGTILKLVVEERPLFYLGIPGVALLFVGMLFGLWTLQIYAAGGYVATNIALASIAFGLVGVFALFTSITLYAILRLTQKTTKH